MPLANEDSSIIRKNISLIKKLLTCTARCAKLRVKYEKAMKRDSIYFRSFREKPAGVRLYG